MTYAGADFDLIGSAKMQLWKAVIGASWLSRLDFTGKRPVRSDAIQWDLSKVMDMGEGMSPGPEVFIPF